MKPMAVFHLSVEYDSTKTDPEKIEDILDQLMQAGRAALGEFIDHGPLDIGGFVLDLRPPEHIPETPADDRCDPLCPGWVTDSSGHIERCDDCKRFTSDEEAAVWAAHKHERKIRYFLEPDVTEDERIRGEPIRCGHSACSQNYIDTGDKQCIHPSSRKEAELHGVYVTRIEKPSARCYKCTKRSRYNIQPWKAEQHGNLDACVDHREELIEQFATGWGIPVIRNYEELDWTPRYTPKEVSLFSKKTGNPMRAPVTGVVAHPPGTVKHFRKDLVVVELITEHGSRHYGVEEAHIDSSLRMFVKGFPKNFEEMAAWEKVPGE